MRSKESRSKTFGVKTPQTQNLDPKLFRIQKMGLKKFQVQKLFGPKNFGKKIWIRKTVQILSVQMSLEQLCPVKEGPRYIPLNVGQNQVSTAVILLT